MNDVLHQVRAPAERHALEASQSTLASVARAQHPGCLMCSPQNPFGLRLEFEVRPDGAVEATVPCGPELQSYPDTLHGGVTAAVIDAAMTNALFALGVVAVTAELTVRFLEPIRLGARAVVRAAVDRVAVDALYYVRAEIQQGERIAARGSGKFLVRCNLDAADEARGQP